MDATIQHRSLNQPWSGSLPVSDYTVLSAAARGYGQARVHIPRDHSLITDTDLTEIRGLQITIHQGLLGSRRYVQVGKPARTDRGWDLTCYQIAYVLKLMKVPVRPAPYRNLPAGMIVRMALTAGLSMTTIPLKLGGFAEAAPYVEEYQFNGQSVDQVIQDMMTLTGQEWQQDDDLRIHWVGRQGSLYDVALTEGWDFCIKKDFEPEDDPLGRVVVTDQRGYTTQPYVAQEHAADLTARTLAIRADTASAGATDALAQSLLNDGRVVRSVGQIGLYPQGGSITVSLPGLGGGGGGGFALMGGGFALMGGGFALMGGGSAGPGDVSYPTFAAPNWALRVGDILRIIAPNAGIRGTHSGLYRVRGVTFGDAHLYPLLDLVEEPYLTAETLPVGRRGALSVGWSPPTSLEGLMVAASQSSGQPIDAARLAHPLSAYQIPALSEIEGTVEPAQVPDLDDLNGSVDTLTQATWTFDTTPPTASTTQYITVDLGGTQYKITAESIS